MRRLALLIAGGAVWLFLFAIPAFADNGPHVKGNFGATPDQCAMCHRAHSAKAEDLLLEAQPALCYSCHGTGVTGASTDVQDGKYFSNPNTPHTGTPSGALRGGGFDYALINTSTYTGSGFGGLTIGTTTAQQTTSHHSADGSPVTMWGWGAAGSGAGTANVLLSCGSCHDPHGSQTYRILKPAPNDSGIVAESRLPGWSNGGRVYINDGATKIYTTTNFGNVQASVTTESPLNSDNSALWYSPTTKNWYGSYTETSSRWCATCHTRYFSPTDGGIEPLMNGATEDPIFTFRHGIRNIIDPTNPGYTVTTVTNPRTSDGPATIDVINPITAGLGSAVAPLTANGVGTGGTAHLSGSGGKLTFSAPKCITCHVSHGSNASMSTTITSQSSPQGAAPAPYLDGTLLRLDNRGMCQACHNK